ncbi:nucleotidyltransferase domain-containing protein [Asticcacaulis sp. 201]|uniref:nucleotidyltransferase domain-containing protein n=1 Tax=Asticcacaulis sp. 201 TaxID=3028787 RepID=UPI0029165673|nr:nucleotidyltransferase domain-containing protein [Asticcacaulis sp. 201]MDV6329854.1 nucleotidyltransferase domain-containing protein [Asticcacaulis sp. 201]
MSSVEKMVRGKACVYATGSFGRLEAGSQSDLDLFIVSKVKKQKPAAVNALSNLDTILVKAELINAVRDLNLPDFDGDGKFLECHSTFDFLNHLGGQEDDYRNILTGRLLMFMEGRPLIGAKVFDFVIDQVLEEYFRDFSDHSDGFIPAFLCNDILRLWRTFCVNYEFARRRKQKKAKVKNFKLKHSRMLTCYSAICFLLSRYQKNGTVTISDAKEMVYLTPLDRIESVSQSQNSTHITSIKQELFAGYADFLKLTDKPEDELVLYFEDNYDELSKNSYLFGDQMRNLIYSVGTNSKFMRLLVV